MQLDKKIMNSLKYLEKYRLVSDEAIVSYSGGKDSKVILDLCCKVFKKVHPFFQYIIDGLSVIDNEIAADEARWGVKVERYPGFGLYGAIENGTYCDVYYKMDELSQFTYNDALEDMQRKTGVKYVAHGGKYADYANRRRLIEISEQEGDGMMYPIKEWTKRDVVTYMAMQGIPVPDAAYVTSGSVDLENNNILWIYDKYPDDFLMLEKYFPYIRAVVYRRKFYGVGKCYGPFAKQGCGREATPTGYGRHVLRDSAGREIAKEGEEKGQGRSDADSLPVREIRGSGSRSQADQERPVQSTEHHEAGEGKPEEDHQETRHG